MCNLERINILDVKIHLVCKDLFFSSLETFMNTDRTRVVFTVNPEFIMIAQKDIEYLKILNSSDINTCDGIGVCLASKIIYKKNLSRIRGSELIYDLPEFCAQHSKSLFLLGGDEISSLKAKEKIQSLCPTIKIANYSPPFLSLADMLKEENKIILNKIKTFQPDVLLVALGPPKQEKWIFKNIEVLSKIGVKIAIGVGGSFDYLSGKAKEPPNYIRKYGLEWLYRLIQEPWRIKRQMALLVFVFLVLKEWWGKRQKKQKGMYSKTTHGTK